MLVNNKCVEVACKSDASCQASHTDYCVKAGYGKPFCGTEKKYCTCNPGTRIRSPFRPRCRPHLTGESGCLVNQFCLLNGFCGFRPTCGSHGSSCSSTFKCCKNITETLYCHTRLFASKPSCLNTAFVGEDCSSGIPCEGGSICMDNKRCSLRLHDACDAPGSVCPTGTKCGHASASEGVNKVCVLS